ncbi:bifunctional phosphopantothenoylcysteine decarboxylase/phosphopantothenate--cysteine ligase CoaBC [Paenibacillus sp. 481]|uniref:bifunctional phosphopantothenoylcysteine decarboxylase/phosphopantothenate--cysteine ligase CoaBC n=1 Tax=Paenibacillus sp. 481 TaxID=2835869 RepID=UPI001E49D3A8|nr:bifunctional phosphopantothenoylcysteine decarboxylase/phosphopantothenate--cysteine ligase CoaBC [Paenibacillus sp. 481]UHA74037.1 bifunctional phosphopantothenoylcysteine decarboxylase/phosphopantothenate--cysteine ligase CoaBC [Paenibacillus sp. 481]
MLNGKTIVLGITGGIAAYKAATLCSKLSQAGANVHVIMTKSATQFISELTLQTLSRNLVYTDTFDERDPEVVSHIHIADSADLVLIAPATANVLAKMAYGLADDMLSTTVLATMAPIMVAPAMNVHMYAHPAVQHNMELLRQRGVLFIEPGEGPLACGYTGKGRLEEPEQIVEQVQAFFNQSTTKKVGAALLETLAPVHDSAAELPLAGRTVLVTAGGTLERIDPVRYITNDSSGKMGFAVAEAARNMGAHVVVVAGQTQVDPPVGVELVRVESTQQMLEAVMARYEAVDVVVKAAAVADYRPVTQAAQKLKKTGERLVIEFERNPDILETLGRNKTHQLLIGFAAETEKLEEHARGKLQRKNCDLIVGNDVSRADAGFGSDNNEVHIYNKHGLLERIPLMSKGGVATRILQLAVAQMQAKAAQQKPVEQSARHDEVHAVE